MEERIENLYNYLVEKKCKDISLYLSNIDDNKQYIFVFTNTNILNNKKFAQTLMEDMDLDIFPEGYHKGEWIVFDFGDIVLHCFVPSAREKYSLDKLYHSKKNND